MLTSVQLKSLKKLNSLQSLEYIPKNLKGLLVIRVETSSEDDLRSVYASIKETFDRLDVETPFIIIPGNISIFHYQHHGIIKDSLLRLKLLFVKWYRKIHPLDVGRNNE